MQVETVNYVCELWNVALFLQSPRADRRSIKQAYYNIMREYHPDSGADSTEFCAMLNEIYAVSAHCEGFGGRDLCVCGVYLSKLTVVSFKCGVVQ